jgi:hypothetical protein
MKTRNAFAFMRTPVGEEFRIENSECRKGARSRATKTVSS